MRFTFNPNAAKAIVGLFFGLAFALYMGTVIVTTEGNPITEVARMIAVFSALAAIVNPRAMLYAMIVMAATLDLGKRLLVLHGSMGYGDVATVLAIAPVTLFAIFTAVVTRRVFQGRLFTRMESVILLVVTAIILYTFAKTFVATKAFLRAGQSAVEGGLYATLLLLVGILMPRAEDVDRLMRFASKVFLPVALYGMTQYFFGLLPFEERYMVSGLTMTEALLDDIHVRPFSTMNSPHSFGVTMALFAIVSFAHLLMGFGRGSDTLRRLTAAGVFLVYVTALLLTFNRTAWAMAAIGMVAVVMFQTVMRTVVLYVGSGILALLIVVNAGWILDRLALFQSYLPMNSDAQEQAFRLGTYSDRLEGFRNLASNPEFRTPFGSLEGVFYARGSGFRQSGAYSHDMLGSMLLNYGYVGTAIVLGLGITLWVRMHKRILMIDDRRRKLVAVSYLGACFSALFTGMLSGSHIGVYPSNFFFWLVLGCLFSITRADLAEGRAIRTGELRHRREIEEEPAMLAE